MKAIFFPIIGLLFSSLTITSYGQVACPCQPVVYLTPDPTDLCCYLLNIDFSNAPGCGTVTNFNQITVNTGVFGGTGVITSASSSAPFSATVNSSTLATFSTAPGFIPAVPAIYAVGQVCFANNSAAFFPAQMVISNGPMDNCAVTSFHDDLTTICTPPSPCDSVFVADTAVCRTDETLSISLQGCSNLPGGCVQQVKWWIQSPCGTGPWILYQVKPDCSDLLLFPTQFTTDICVYAEVITNPACNCPPVITSNTATILLCDPVGCTIPKSITEFCDCGTPAPLTVLTTGGTLNCPYTITWYDGQGNVVGNTSTYAPPTLCFQGPPDDCYQDYTYKAVIMSPCGKDSCETVFRIYNDNAPKGKLEMDPVESQPFCPGEDAVLKYTPGCAGDPKMWEWWVRPCVGGSPTQLTTAGNMNPVFFTNRLYQSVYFYVRTINGVCPFDTSQLKIEVKEPSTIISFNAVADPCVEQQVGLSLDFKPCTIEGCGTNCNCTYSVDWYKDGFVVGTNSGVPPIATFTYTGPPPLWGNYYAVLKDDCCPGDSVVSQLIKIEPTCEPKIDGPCFMCNGVPVTLEGEMILPPRFPCPDISGCAFSWYELVSGVEVNLNNSTQTQVATHPGVYIFESNCNGCVKRDTFSLPGCNNPCSCGSLLWGEFVQEWNFTTPIDENTQVLAPCPKAGKNYWIHGDFDCAQFSCGDKNVTWELTRPSPLPPVTGSSFVIYPHFDAILPWSQCVQPGIYTLKITRQCGVVPCSYTFKFEVPNCGCLCSDLPADGGLGFGTGSNGIGCIRYFKPYGLDACDVVTWTINGNQAPGSSIGNNGFNYNFTTLGSGTYTVCMTVTRTPLVGPPCTYTKCQTVTVNCGGPFMGLCAAGSSTKNGNFTDGLVRGHLGDGSGEVADWMQLPEVTDGEVFIDDSAGGYDIGYLVLFGGLDNPASIFQQVELGQELYTNIQYNLLNIGGGPLPAGTKLEFKLYSDPDGTEQQLIYVDSVANSVDTGGWVLRSVSVENSPNLDYPYLVVSLTNEESGARSVVGLDNLEVCNSSSPLGTGPELLPGAVFRLFPNPATDEITLKWSGLEVKRGSVQIIDNLGRRLRTIPIPDGSASLTTPVADLPDGVYFVKVISGRKSLKVLKLIKF